MAVDDFEQPAYLDPGTIDGHPGLNWYTRVEKVYGRDLRPSQWLDSLDHSGARTIHHITDLDTGRRLVWFSDIEGDSEQVRADVKYDVVDPASQVAPDGTPVGGLGPRPPRGDNPDVCIRCRVAPSRTAWGCCVTCQMAEVMDLPVSEVHALFDGSLTLDCRTDEEVLHDLAHDPVIGDALARAEADKKIRKFEAQRARHRTLRRLVRYVAIRLVVVAAVVVLVWLFADALSGIR